MEFLEKIKKEIRPDKSVLIEINKFTETINESIKKNKIKAVCVPGGSIAKGTFLKDDFDVDLFVKFDYSYKKENLSELLEKVLKGHNYEMIHGSRDYFQININKINYELVPVLDVKNPELALNVTDMSPLHVDWVIKNLKKGQDDEIRLTKKFCKTIGVYGAESYIRGFSGHVIDILIIYYGSFLTLLKESKKWKAPLIIDTEKYYKTSREILFNMNQSKVEGPIIIVDPILKTRNAASAISYEKFALFKKKAFEFLKDPSEKYFVQEEIGKTYLKKKYRKNLFILSLEAKKGKRDVVGSKILKAFKFMKIELMAMGFEVKEAGWHWNNKKHVLFWFVFKETTLPEKRVIEGPPIEMKDACKNFKKKYKKCFEKNKKLNAEHKIEKRGAKENILEISANIYFKEKIFLKDVETQ